MLSLRHTAHAFDTRPTETIILLKSFGLYHQHRPRGRRAGERVKRRAAASETLGCHFGRQDEAGAVHPATHSGDPTGQPSLIVARRHVAAEVGASQPMDVFTDAETTPTSSRPPVGSSSRQLACLPLGSPTHLHASPTAGLRVPRRAAEAARPAADGGPTSSTRRPGRHHSSQPTSTFEPAAPTVYIQASASSRCKQRLVISSRSACVVVVTRRSDQLFVVVFSLGNTVHGD